MNIYVHMGFCKLFSSFAFSWHKCCRTRLRHSHPFLNSLKTASVLEWGFLMEIGSSVIVDQNCLTIHYHSSPHQMTLPVASPNTALITYFLSSANGIGCCHCGTHKFVQADTPSLTARPSSKRKRKRNVADNFPHTIEDIVVPHSLLMILSPSFL